MVKSFVEINERRKQEERRRKKKVRRDKRRNEIEARKTKERGKGPCPYRKCEPWKWSRSPSRPCSKALRCPRSPARTGHHWCNLRAMKIHVFKREPLHRPGPVDILSPIYLGWTTSSSRSAGTLGNSRDSAYRPKVHGERNERYFNCKSKGSTQGDTRGHANVLTLSNFLLRLWRCLCSPIIRRMFMCIL